MTDFLQLVLSPNPDGATTGLLTTAMKVGVSIRIAPSIASQLRLEFRASERRLSIEPFVESAALSALWGIRKKRQLALELTSVLLAASLSAARRVTLLRGREGASLEPIVKSRYSDEEWKAHVSGPCNIEFEAETRWTCVPSVEVRLNQPIRGPDGKPVRGFIQSVWLKVPEPDCATWYVSPLMADQGIVISHGQPFLDTPPVHLVSANGFVARAGRAFFPDAPSSADGARLGSRDKD